MARPTDRTRSELTNRGYPISLTNVNEHSAEGDRAGRGFRRRDQRFRAGGLESIGGPGGSERLPRGGPAGLTRIARSVARSRAPSSAGSARAAAARAAGSID